MKRTLLAVATVLGLISASLPAHAQAPVLARGDDITGYFTQLYIASVTQVAGNQCTFTAQNYYRGLIEFTAGSGAGPTFILPDPNDAQGLPATFIFHLPPIPGGGSTTWTGTYTKQLLPEGILFGPNPFSGTLQVTSRLSFVGTMILTNLGAGNGSSSCNVEVQFSSVFTGAAQRL
jgi:hypothetical protein